MQISWRRYGKANFMRFLREATGLTQRELAEFLKVTERTIQNYESGKTNFNSDKIEKIIEKFDLDIIVRANRKH